MAGGARGAKIGAGLGALGVGAAVIIGEGILGRATDASLDKILPADTTALLVNVEYPDVDPYCGQVDLGLPAGAPSPTSFAKDNPVELREEMLRLGGKPVGNGEAILRLTMPPQEVAYVVEIRPVVFEKGQMQAEWRYKDLIPCGGPVSARTFFVNFDDGNPRLVDLGVFEGGPDDPMVPRQSLGREFTVSEAEPIRINVVGMSCESSVSWGLEIEYIHEGTSKTMSVATPNEPFVIYGSDVPTWSPGTEDGYSSRTGVLEPAPNTPNSCLDLAS